MDRNKKKKDEQLKLGIKYQQRSFLERVSSSFSNFKDGLELNPYWRSGYSWLSLLSSLILGFNSFLLIYVNFDRLPARIAMMFAEKLEEDIVKDKYLLYFLPLLTISLGTMLTFLAEKLFTRFPQTIKFFSFIIFLMSLIQLIAVYKIINIYS